MTISRCNQTKAWIVALVSGAVLATFPARAQEAGAAAAPSGLALELVDIRQGEGNNGPVTYFRFVAPGIGRDGPGAPDPLEIGTDMAHLCETVAVPYLAGRETPPRDIVIVLMDRVVPFGEADPQATQFFDSYRLTDGHCAWERF